MEKNTRLVNIYIKIYNKCTLTMDDLRYLSKYDPECFEKTCKNIVYKIPEIKEILQPEPETPKEPQKAPLFEAPPADRERIQAALANLKRMERKDLSVGEVRADQVKDLLGNLYMEMLFPHNDRKRYFSMEQEREPLFNKKA